MLPRHMLASCEAFRFSSSDGMGAAWAACCALAGAPQAELEAHDVQQMTDSTNDELADKWSRPTTWPPRKRLPERGPDAPHVVLSTKFQEPWFTISIGIKEVLEELGCTVYNPNTDNKELHKDEANDRWLRTFCENLDKIQEARNGFVLQIQQGVVREKSHMQIAEERMGKQWSVPCMGLYAFAITHLRGGGSLAEQFRWSRSGSSPSGTGSCAPTTTAWSKARLGNLLVCERRDLRGGVCVYEQGEDKGWGVQITADGQRACLMLDGEIAREVTVAEARGVARELGLPDLPYTNVSAKDALEEC
eukprot:s3084_g2.t3